MIDSFSVVLFDDRALERECFVYGAKAHHKVLTIKAFASVDDWRVSGEETDVTVVVFAVGRRSLTRSDLSKTLKTIIAKFSPVPVVVMGGLEDAGEFSLAVKLGARGYVPATMGIETVLIATHVIATLGGAFLPAHVLNSIGHASGDEQTAETPTKDEPQFGAKDMLTARQLAVAHKLRLGMPNKNIAYELGMCESTVKVHVREIMKRVKATNRTEAAVILNDTLAQRTAVLHKE